MPIKFRCQHCEQLLGISRARAGALVDCPQCGRSLRVPSLDGKTRSVPDAKESVRDDGDLLSALSQLSALSTDAPESVETRSSDGGAGVVQGRELAEESRRSQVRKADVAERHVSPAGRIVPSSEETATFGEPLKELAESFGPTDVSDLGFDAEPRNAGSGVLWLLAAVAMAVCAAGGWWLGRNASGETGATSESGAAAKGKAAGSDVGGKAGGDAMHPPEPAAVGTVHGAVMYEDAAGLRLADSAAMVILLPKDRKGTVLLSARSLRRDADDPDFQATLAALNVLGGGFAVAGENGRFALNATPAGAYTLVAISRHVERPEDLSVPPEVGEVLSRYFDSINYLSGRLAAKAVAVDVAGNDSVAVDVIVFDRNP